MMEERRHNPALKNAAQRIDELEEKLTKAEELLKLADETIDSSKEWNDELSGLVERKNEKIAKLNAECAELSYMNMYLEEQVKDYEKALKQKNNSLYGESVVILAEAERDLMMRKTKLINQINDIDGLNKLATQMYLKIDYNTDKEFESLLRAFIQTTEKIIGELKNET